MLREQVHRKKGGSTINDLDGPSVRESREEKRLEDRLVWVALWCGAPFIYLAIDHASLTTLILFQAYALTATVGCIVSIKKRAVLNQKWFLNAMACSLPVHFAAIAAIFYWDKANPEVAFKGFYTVGVVWVAGVVEMVIIVAILEFWKNRQTRSAF